MKQFLGLLAILLVSVPLSARQGLSASLSTTTCPGAGCQVVSTTGQGTAALQVTGTFVGTLTITGSVDGINYASIVMYPVAGGASVSTATSTGIWVANIAGLSTVKIAFTAYTSGTAVTAVAFSQNPMSFTSSALGASTAVIGHTIVDTAPTTAVTIASMPSTPVTVAATLTTQMAGWSFSNVVTNATTVVKSGAGVLHCVTVNGLGTTETATVYDNTAASGTKIGTVSVSAVGQTGCYDVAFATGLTVVTAGAVAADITVSYR